MNLLSVLANWVPDPTPDWRTSPNPYITLMVIGFIIGVVGHIMRSRATQALGIGMIFLATFLLPVITNLSHS